MSEFDYKRDFVHQPGRHVQSFANNLPRSIKVWVEMYPDIYILRSGDELTIVYDEDPKWPGLGLHTIIHEDSLQIYLQEFDTAVILINGQKAEPTT